MSFLLFASIAAVSAGAAGAIRAVHRARKAEVGSQPSNAQPAPASMPSGGVVLAVGDVVCVDQRASSGAIERQERFLTGALVASEAGSVAGALFVAPEVGSDGYVFVFAAPRRELGWLSPARVVVANQSEPPSTLEFDQTPLRLQARFPVEWKRFGKGAPRMGEGGMLAIYEDGSGQLGVLLRGEQQALGFLGVVILEGDYERMGNADP